MKRYLVLFVCLVAAAMMVAPVFRRIRLGRRAGGADRGGRGSAVAIEIRDGAVTPATVAVPKGSRVRLAVTNRGGAAARVRLAGYEDRVDFGRLAPGQTERREFVADRPGEDFTWLVDGRPAGASR